MGICGGGVTLFGMYSPDICQKGEREKTGILTAAETKGNMLSNKLGIRVLERTARSWSVDQGTKETEGFYIFIFLVLYVVFYVTLYY